MRNVKLFKRKECRILTWPGKLVLAFVFLFAFLLFLKFIPAFLSTSKPNKGGILVLDGQMPDFAVKKAIQIFESGDYKYIVTTGGKIQTGYFIAEYKSMAEFTAATFRKLGFEIDKLVVIPGGDIKRDRTYNSALSLKKWMIENEENSKQVDVLSVGSHARRSRLLFKKAFDNEKNIGIISIEDPAYNPRKWWESSVGARVVISEALAYFYVLMFFKG
jgi:uncharacterized SAM-binding protein YcdF (DUF218 family)